jgi:hypothetical protein
MKKYLLGLLIISLLFMTTGCKKSIVGKWKAIDKESEYYYIFNSDKTCSYEMTVARLDCTYEENDSKLTILYNGTENPVTFEYRFENNMLIIKDDTGNDNKFVKEEEPH